MKPCISSAPRVTIPHHTESSNAVAVKKRLVGLVKATSVIAVLGIVLNRFNVSLVAFNWKLPAEDRYFPHVFEFIVSLTLVTAGLVAFRWIVKRMPVLNEHPDYRGAH